MENAVDGLSILFRSKLDNLLNSHGNLMDAFMKFHQVQSVLQEGPTCGFASLLTAMRSCSAAGMSDLTLDVLVEMAKHYGITNSGELFSAQWICDFVKHLWPNQFALTAANFPSPLEMVKHLTSDERRPLTILVPYDCDKNFEPCSRNGHAAHWALIIGFVLLSPTSVGPDRTYVISSSRLFEFNQNNRVEVAENVLYLIAYQGNSRHQALWSYGALKESNAQLEAPNPKGSANFRMAPEGMAAIRGRCVLFGGD